jgi:hypothetical protein
LPSAGVGVSLMEPSAPLARCSNKRILSRMLGWRRRPPPEPDTASSGISTERLLAVCTGVAETGVAETGGGGIAAESSRDGVLNWSNKKTKKYCYWFS